MASGYLGSYHNFSLIVKYADEGSLHWTPGSLAGLNPVVGSA